MITLGIDLASEPKGTGAVTINWAAGDVTVHDQQLSDDVLVDLMAGVDVAAVDVPLGWPSPFVAAVIDHNQHGAWPVDTGHQGWRRPPQYRATDLAVAQQGGRPLSVSTDRIGSTAMRGAGIQHRLPTAGLTVDRTGKKGVLVKTYPAAVLVSRQMASTKYKGSGAAGAALEALIDDLATQCGDLRPAMLYAPPRTVRRRVRRSRVRHRRRGRPQGSHDRSARRPRGGCRTRRLDSPPDGAPR